MNYLNKSEQIKAGVIEGFKNGKSKHTMRRCYGYDISKDGSLVINPKEASTVQWIFQRYLHGEKPWENCRWLGKAGDPFTVRPAKVK